MRGHCTCSYSYCYATWSSKWLCELKKAVVGQRDKYSFVVWPDSHQAMVVARLGEPYAKLAASSTCLLYIMA